MKKANNNPSAKKKLIPAAGALMISAAMLGTSTYAWFTMSREVEVTGIKMTATVPEDLQISPGWTTSNENHNEQVSFEVNGTDSFLMKLSSSGKAADPSTTDLQMWSNTLDISHYYKLGKIIPASSYNGQSIFFTPDANGVGKTVKTNAAYYFAANGLDAKDQNTVPSGAATGNFMTTLHANSGSSDSWSASGAAAWNDTKDDGYYVDIPVWIRSSSDQPVNLSVKAQAIYDTNAARSGADVELYKAVRAVVIEDGGAGTRGGTTNATYSGTNGLIPVVDGSGTTYKYVGDSIVDFYGASGTHHTASGAVYNSGTANGQYAGATNGGTSGATNWSDIYTAATMYEGTSVVTIPAKTAGSDYGAYKKVWIRVWLEGEDPECWNQNAGQDFSIDLVFTKL